jgi:hypothetical protein
MIPNNSGSALGTVTAAAPVVYNFKVKLPDYIYRKDKVAVVAFAQKNSTKEIFNSGYMGIVPFPSTANTGVVELWSEGGGAVCF